MFFRKKEAFMVIEPFGNMAFDMGWNAETHINLWGNDFTVTVTVDADEKTDGPSIEQEKTIKEYCANTADKMSSVEKQIVEFTEDADQAKTLYKPNSLIFERDGGCVIMFDCAEDPADIENGIAVRVLPYEEVLTLEEYL